MSEAKAKSEGGSRKAEVKKPTAKPELGAERIASRFGDAPLAIYEAMLPQYAMAQPVARADNATHPAAAINTSTSRVAVVYCVGVMFPRAEWYDEVSTERVAAQLRAAAADDTIDTIVLVIDSPGGSAQGQFELEAAAAEAAEQKTLIAQVVGTCCSAAYWLASYAHKIYAGASDQIGSIGVRYHAYDYSKMFAENGVEVVDIATGPHKSFGLRGTPITKEQRAHMRERVDYIFAKFETAVRTGRGFDDGEWAAASGGQVWYAEKALELGLIDAIQTLEVTFAGLAGTTTTAGPAGRTLIPRSQVMAKETTDGGPQAASLSELKKAFPKATADFYVEQVEADATLTEAAIAYANAQEAKAEAAEKEAAEAKEAAEKAAEEKAKEEKSGAEKAGAEKPKRGAPALGGQAKGEESADEPDYREMAVALMEKKKCRWTEACLEIKRKHPESRGHFGAPPAKAA